MKFCSEEESQQTCQGGWTKDEHYRFLVGVIQHGKDWKIVEKVVKTRKGPQVRSHAQKFFIKLNKIAKERKKAKNQELIQPSPIQKEILDHFNQTDCTANTPAEISALLRKDWSALPTLFKAKTKTAKLQRTPSTAKLGIVCRSDRDDSSRKEGSTLTKNDMQEGMEESYFMKFIKMNKEHFISGHDFNELIDFKPNNSAFAEDTQATVARHSKRKRSFFLPDEEENETKLKETLSNLHRKFGCQDTP